METKDYWLEVKIRNGRIKNLMTENGIANVMELSRLVGCAPARLYRLVNFQDKPVKKNGEWNALTLLLAKFFGVLPDELFSAEHLTLSCESNRRDYMISHDEVMKIAGEFTAPAEDGLLEESDMREMVDFVVSTLTPREERVIKMRFGLGDYDETTLAECAEHHGVSRERIRQIEYKALRKLRHPSRSSMLQLERYGELSPK